LRHVFARFAFLALHFIQTCTSRSLASASGNFAILYTPELTFSSIYNDVYDINIFGTAVSKSVKDKNSARKIPLNIRKKSAKIRKKCFDENGGGIMRGFAHTTS
jgi:hypothetical protein